MNKNKTTKNLIAMAALTALCTQSCIIQVVEDDKLKDSLLMSSSSSLDTVSTSSSSSKDSVSVDSNSFIDRRDGQHYKTVQIGTQKWMAQNLNYKSPSNDSYCYSSDSLQCNKNGRLYTWKSAKESCPMGWHLSSEQEWMTLEKFLGETEATVQLSGWRGKAGALLKDKSIGGTGTTGLNLFATGTRRTNGTFVQNGEHGQYWTATEQSTSFAWYRDIYIGYSGIYKMSNTDGYGKENAFAVRCIAD
jgi:uncharacterized protein (TIGR02145 family)